MVTLMLMDKGYYDYDYKRVKEKAIIAPEDREIWSAEKLNAILGVKPKATTPTDEEIRAAGMEFLNEKLKTQNTK